MGAATFRNYQPDDSVNGKLPVLGCHCEVQEAQMQVEELVKVHVAKNTLPPQKCSRSSVEIVLVLGQAQSRTSGPSDKVKRF